jgi:hypothetical protein
MFGGHVKARDIGSILIAVAAFAVFFYLGVAREFYSASVVRDDLFLTIALRKTYSLLAFAALGFFSDFAVARPWRPLRVLEGALLIGGVSALIEVVQDLRGSREGLAWNAGDVLFGMLGGVLGVLLARWVRSRSVN